MIAALAGRRIDAEDAVATRFPLDNLEVVRERLIKCLKARHIDTLVCAAACGADLLALDAASALGLRRRIVLPTPHAMFREASVVDRPGQWGELYDSVIAEAVQSANLVELDVGDGQPAFLKANRAIIAEAESFAETAGSSVLAVVVWEGSSRGEDDVTLDFFTTASRRGHEVVQVLTI